MAYRPALRAVCDPVSPSASYGDSMKSYLARFSAVPSIWSHQFSGAVFS